MLDKMCARASRKLPRVEAGTLGARAGMSIGNVDAPRAASLARYMRIYDVRREHLSVWDWPPRSLVGSKPLQLLISYRPRSRPLA